MERPEDNADRLEDSTLPGDSRASNGHLASFSPESGHPDDPANDSTEIGLPRDQWSIEVVPAPGPDATDRMSQAIEILLNAAAHPRQ